MSPARTGLPSPVASTDALVGPLLSSAHASYFNPTTLISSGPTRKVRSTSGALPRHYLPSPMPLPEPTMTLLSSPKMGPSSTMPTKQTVQLTLLLDAQMMKACGPTPHPTPKTTAVDLPPYRHLRTCKPAHLHPTLPLQRHGRLPSGEWRQLWTPNQMKIAVTLDLEDGEGMKNRLRSSPASYV